MGTLKKDDGLLGEIWSLEHQNSGLGRMEVQSILGIKKSGRYCLNILRKLSGKKRHVFYNPQTTSRCFVGGTDKTRINIPELPAEVKRVGKSDLSVGKVRCLFKAGCGRKLGRQNKEVLLGVECTSW